MERIERADRLVREDILGTSRDLFRDLEHCPRGGRLREDRQHVGTLRRREASIAFRTPNNATCFDQGQARRGDLRGFLRIPAIVITSIAPS